MRCVLSPAAPTFVVPIIAALWGAVNASSLEDLRQFPGGLDDPRRRAAGVADAVTSAAILLLRGAYNLLDGGGTIGGNVAP